MLLISTHRKKKSHFQSTSWTRRPGRTLPPDAPMGAIAPKRATDMFRIRPGGNVMVRRAIEFGTIIPPPIPVRARSVQSAMKFLVKPDTSENNTHHTPEIVTMFLCPKIIPSRPPIRTKAPCVKLQDRVRRVRCVCRLSIRLTGSSLQAMQSCIHRRPSLGR